MSGDRERAGATFFWVMAFTEATANALGIHLDRQMQGFEKIIFLCVIVAIIVLLAQVAPMLWRSQRDTGSKASSTPPS